MSGEKVVFLKYRNDNPTDTQEILACKRCRNKTWTAVYDGASSYPRLTCAACGIDGGRFGWAPEGDEE